MNRYAVVLAGAAMLIAPRAARTQIVEADLPSEHWSAGVDVGWAGEYDDSGLWWPGFAVGVSGYYSVATTLLAGARFGVSHWAYNATSVEDALVPPGAYLIGLQSTGQTEIIEFGGFLRGERPATLEKMGVIAQGTAMLGYVKHFALTEASFESLRGNELATYELNESNWRVVLMVGAGLNHPLTEQSVIEVFPWYRFVFENGDVVAIPGISVGWRVRV